MLRRRFALGISAVLLAVSGTLVGIGAGEAGAVPPPNDSSATFSYASNSITYGQNVAVAAQTQSAVIAVSPAQGCNATVAFIASNASGSPVSDAGLSGSVSACVAGTYNVTVSALTTGANYIVIQVTASDTTSLTRTPFTFTVHNSTPDSNVFIPLQPPNTSCGSSPEPPTAHRLNPSIHMAALTNPCYSGTWGTPMGVLAQTDASNPSNSNSMATTLGGGSVSYFIDAGANGNTSDSGCSFSNSSQYINETGTGHCYVYAVYDPSATGYNSYTTVDTDYYFGPVDQGSLSLSGSTQEWEVPVTLGTKLSGGSGSGSVTYTLTPASDQYCSISNGVLTELEPGSCYVYAVKGNDPNYNEQTSNTATYTFTIAAQNPAISNSVPNDVWWNAQIHLTSNDLQTTNPSAWMTGQLNFAGYGDQYWNSIYTGLDNLGSYTNSVFSYGTPQTVQFALDTCYTGMSPSGNGLCGSNGNLESASDPGCSLTGGVLTYAATPASFVWAADNVGGKPQGTCAVYAYASGNNLYSEAWTDDYNITFGVPDTYVPFAIQGTDNQFSNNTSSAYTWNVNPMSVDASSSVTLSVPTTNAGSLATGQTLNYAQSDGNIDCAIQGDQVVDNTYNTDGSLKTGWCEFVGYYDYQTGCSYISCSHRLHASNSTGDGYWESDDAVIIFFGAETNNFSVVANASLVTPEPGAHVRGSLGDGSYYVANWGQGVSLDPQGTFDTTSGTQEDYFPCFPAWIWCATGENPTTAFNTWPNEGAMQYQLVTMQTVPQCSSTNSGIGFIPCSDPSCQLTGRTVTSNEPGTCFVYAYLNGNEQTGPARSTNIIQINFQNYLSLYANADTYISGNVYGSSIDNSPTLYTYGFWGNGNNVSFSVSSGSCTVGAPYVNTNVSGPGSSSYGTSSTSATVSSGGTANDCVITASYLDPQTGNTVGSNEITIQFREPQADLLALSGNQNPGPWNTSTSTLSVHHELGTGAVTFAIAPGSDRTCAVSPEGVVSAGESGNCLVTATVAGDETFEAGTTPVYEVTFTTGTQAITIENAAHQSASSASVTWSQGATYQVYASSTGASVITFAATNNGVCTVNATTGLVSITSAGVCYLTVSASGNPNYTPLTATFTLSVMPAPQTLTLYGNGNKGLNWVASLPYGGTFAISATTTAPGETIAYHTTSWNICQVDGVTGTVTARNPGICYVVVTSNGNSNYQAAQATYNLTIRITKTASLRFRGTAATLSTQQRASLAATARAMIAQRGTHLTVVASGPEANARVQSVRAALAKVLGALGAKVKFASPDKGSSAPANTVVISYWVG